MHYNLDFEINRLHTLTRSNLIMGGVLGFTNVLKNYYALHDIPAKKKNSFFREFKSNVWCPFVDLKSAMADRLVSACCKASGYGELKDERQIPFSMTIL